MYGSNFYESDVRTGIWEPGNSLICNLKRYIYSSVGKGLSVNEGYNYLWTVRSFDVDP